MRHITKGDSDYHLSRRHQSPPTTPEEAKRTWRGFRGQRKKATHEKCMLEEQYSLCAYSEIALPEAEEAEAEAEAFQVVG